MRNEFFKLFAFVAIPLLLFYAIPTGYRIQNAYEVTGQVSDLSNLPALIEQTLQSNVQCRLLPTGLELSCGAEKLSRRQANHLSRMMTEHLTTKLGWIFPDQLELRVEERRQEKMSAESELASIRTRLSEIGNSLKPLERETDKLKRANQQIETDLTNRKRQMEMIQEGLSSSGDAKRKELFESKMIDLSASIAELEEKFLTAQNKYLTLAAPILERDALIKRADDLSQSITQLERKISTWQSMIGNTKRTIQIRDSETFQLSLKGPLQKPEPVRNLSHIPWSILLGFLGFGWRKGRNRLRIPPWRKKNLTPKPRAVVFQTPEEVTQWTGIEVGITIET